MNERRTYGQGCPVAHALDLVGERWALLVVRELRLGPRRYRDLQRALPGITPGVLAQRLKDLERVGIVHRRELPAPAAVHVYELTEWGYELEPVFVALARWGVRTPVVPLEGPVSTDSVMLGLRTFFGTDAEPWSATYQVRVDSESYRLRVDGGRLAELTRGEATAPDIVIETDQATWQSVLGGDRDLADAIHAGALTLTGDVAALRRLIAVAATSR